MAKKKKKTKASTTSFSEAIGIKHFFISERLIFLLGALLGVVAIIMMTSFVSYFTTGAADQSTIENLRSGELMNEHRIFANKCGSMGAYLSYYFIHDCFGLAAFAIPLFLLMVALRMMRIYQINLLKWFLCLVLIMVWASVIY